MNCLLTVTALVLLAAAYEQVIVPIHNFGGFGMAESSALDMWQVAVVAGLAAVILPNKAASPGDLFLWLQFGVSIIPAGVLVAKGGADSEAFWLPLLGLGVVQIARFKRNQFRTDERAALRVDGRVVRICAVLTVSILAAVIVTVRGKWNLNLEDVYLVREEVRDLYSPLLQYLLPTAGMALLPFLVVVALRNRRYLAVVALEIVGVAFFAFSSHKAMAFYPIAVAGGWFVARQINSHRWILLGIIAISVASIALASLEGPAVWVSGLSLHRILFLPVQITNFYIDYFSNHPRLLWAESKVTLGLMSSGLPSDAAQFIGEEYFGRPDVVANTGWISTGYMNAGVIGIIIYGVVIGRLYAFIDAKAQQLGRQFVTALFLVPVATIVLTADLLTTVLTHGLGVVVVLVLVCSQAVGERGEQ